MNWYKDISKNYTELGLKSNPQWAFVKPCCFGAVFLFVFFVVLNFLLLNQIMD